MRKVFLTSGLVVCMACPAFAVSDNVTGSSKCDVNVLGVSEPESTANIEAKWTPNISGAITLISSVYPNNNTGATATYTTSTTEAVTAANPSTVYSKFDVGMFSDSNASTAITGVTIPSKKGYDFDGFYNTESTPVAMTNSAGVFTADADNQVASTGGTATWYAHWTAKEFSVIYNPGYAATSEVQTPHSVTGDQYTDSGHAYDSVYTVLNNTDSNLGYSVTGYHFNGWRADKDIATDSTTALTDSYMSGGTQYSAGDSATYKVEGNVNMYAQWAPNTYTATYLPGAHATNSAQYSYQDTDGLVYDTTYTTKTESGAGITTATGYTFRGWSTNSEAVYNPNNNTLLAEGAPMDAPWTQTSGMTLYAIYSANGHSITYTCGIVPQDTQSALTDSAPAVDSSVVYNSGYVLASTEGGCALPGYHFGGWRCDYNLTSGAHETAEYASSSSNGVWSVTNSGTFLVDHDVTCDVIWTPNEIGLTWYADSGTNSAMSVDSTSQSCTYDDTIAVPTAPDKTGYTFNGWKVRTQQGN